MYMIYVCLLAFVFIKHDVNSLDVASSSSPDSCGSSVLLCQFVVLLFLRAGLRWPSWLHVSLVLPTLPLFTLPHPPR